MTTYYQVLISLEYLLDKVGEKRWRDWIHQDIELWNTQRDVSHHLSAYGGMGSFNDIVICVQNGYKTTKQQEPWLNNLFEILKGLCFNLAHNPEKDEHITRNTDSRYISIFPAFKHNLHESQIDQKSQQLSEIMSQLHGWRCLKCGYAETSTYNIDDYIAREILPNHINNAQTAEELKKIVDATINMKFEEVENFRNRINQITRNSSINIVDRDKWMRPCPNCGSNNTAVYRWRVENEIFTPPRDNLPLAK